MSVDWTVVLEKSGIGGALILLIYFGFQGFKLMINQWKSSTEAVNKNTKAFVQLSHVFEKSSQREIEFQKEIMKLLNEGQYTIKDTHKKVEDIQKTVKDIQQKIS